MNAIWLAMRYVLDQAHCRARAALRGEPESGALTLEWLIIAVGVAIVAGLAYTAFSAAVSKEQAKLP